VAANAADAAGAPAARPAEDEKNDLTPEQLDQELRKGNPGEGPDPLKDHGRR
jgi:hypothetical protein